MTSDGEMYRISVADAHALPEDSFRNLFCTAINDLVGEVGTGALGIAFLNEGKSARDLSTSEMRQIVLAHQSLLNPTAPKVLHQREALTLEQARGMLDIGAERGLKILFCDAVHALNEWRGPWSQLPAVPEKCSTADILDLLEQHPHWFVPSSATVA